MSFIFRGVFTVCMHLSVYQGKPAGYQSWHVEGFACLDR